MRFLALLFALLPAVAFGQSSPNWPVGYRPTAAEWNAVFAKKYDVGAPLTAPAITGGSWTGGTMNGLFLGAPTFNSASFGFITTPANTFTQSGAATNGPLSITGNFNGTSTNSNPSMASFGISRATVDSSGSQNGFFNTTFQMNFGDVGGAFTGTKGGQGGVLVAINHDGPVASGGNAVFVGALNAWFNSSSSITGGNNGNAFAFNPQVIIGTAASGYSLVENVEGSLRSSMTVNTVATRGWLNMFSGGTNQAPVDDYAIGIFKDVVSSDVPFKNGMVFSRNNGPFGIDAAGSLISAPVQRNGGPANGWVNQVVAYGVNLPTVNFSTAAWWTPGTQILGDGTHRIGTGTIAPVTAGLSIDVNDYSGGTPTISNAGASYVANDQLYDTNGGILQVDTVNGSGNIQTWHYLRTPYSYGGAGAATMALRGGSGNQAAVVGVTWTHRTELDIGSTNATVIRLGNSGSDTIVSGSFDIATVRTATTFAVLDSGNAAGFIVNTPGGGNSISSIAVTSVTSGNPKISVNGTAANLILGTGAALATNATTGFIAVPTMAGSPTGTAGAAGQAALVVDTTNKKICYSTGGGTWECSGAFTP